MQTQAYAFTHTDHPVEIVYLRTIIQLIYLSTDHPVEMVYFIDILFWVNVLMQESMSAHEVESAIHTDSRHSDRLRAAYASKETAECGYVTFRRIEFLGSRKSFEMLKRVSGDNNSNVYELLLRA